MLHHLQMRGEPHNKKGSVWEVEVTSRSSGFGGTAGKATFLNPDSIDPAFCPGFPTRKGQFSMNC